GIELDHLARADGIIFVASADPERWEHTDYYFSRMLAHLNLLGRSPHSLPLVLQVNRGNDCDEVVACHPWHAPFGLPSQRVSASWLRLLPVSYFEQLGWPVSAIIPTIAYQRRGLQRLMDTMLEQIDARQPAEQ
ncbi:MAG: hypothetical protein RBU37_10645, partial [Myxococcota bacterium]|nr:hypothetical protein [Myxococcota bacterium]